MASLIGWLTDLTPNLHGIFHLFCVPFLGPYRPLFPQRALMLLMLGPPLPGITSSSPTCFLHSPFYCLQIAALLYYLMSYFPGGSTGARFMLGVIGKGITQAFGACTRAIVR